jgi:DNA-binding LacI/PurR family transcriptional regulator
MTLAPERAREGDPPLTAVRQDVRELGRGQVGALIDAIARAWGANGASATDAAAPVVAGPRLVIRKSVAPVTLWASCP